MSARPLRIGTVHAGTNGRAYAPFVKIPSAVILEHGERLGVYGVAVYAALAAHADPDRRCWPSYNRIAKLLSISRVKVIAAVRLLGNLGLITVTPRSNEEGQKSNAYTLSLSFSINLGRSRAVAAIAFSQPSVKRGRRSRSRSRSRL